MYKNVFFFTFLLHTPNYMYSFYISINIIIIINHDSNLQNFFSQMNIVKFRIFSLPNSEQEKYISRFHFSLIKSQTVFELNYLSKEILFKYSICNRSVFERFHIVFSIFCASLDVYE